MNNANEKEVIYTNYESMLLEKEQLEKENRQLKQELRSLPRGNIYPVHNGKYIKWFRSYQGVTAYIPKDNRELARKLAYKKYLSSHIKYNEKEIELLQTCMQGHQTNLEKSHITFIEKSEYSNLLADSFHLDKALEEWVQGPFEQSGKYPEQLMFPCVSGDIVRSKSERMIATVLYANKIPFRYECALEIKHVTFYPDFTIMHPRTHQLFYYEHFGMMDRPEYIKKTFEKLEEYALYDIIPSINLITSFETQKKPLNYETVEKIVRDYFL